MDAIERLKANARKNAGTRLTANEARALLSLLPVDANLNVQTKAEWPKPIASEREIKIHIRWMIRRDMPTVMAIDEHGLRWDEETFIRHLRQRDTIGMVAEWNEQVVGQMIYELHKNRLQIVSFAVDPDYRRKKVGSQMIAKLRSKLSEQRRNRIVLEVPEESLGMQLFLKRCGFRADSVGNDGYKFVLRHVAEVSR